MVNNHILRFLDKHPILQKLTHKIWVKYLNHKYDFFYFLISRGTYKEKFVSLSGQDKWVIEEVFNKKRGRFFLDIGAYDGYFLSNTFTLEKNYDWKGICVEPSKKNFDLMKNKYARKCLCVNELVDGTNEKVTFIESDDSSGIVAEDTANNEEYRSSKILQSQTHNKLIELEPITLYQLLKKHNAPNVIDYFSFDVEGAEERILKKFPFEKYIFLSMTIERPTPELNKILFENGYIFIKNSFFDSFYVHKSLPNLDSLKKQPFKQINKKMF